MTEYTSAEDLTAGDLGDGEDFHLPSGKVVRIRGLSRHETLTSTKGLMNSDGVISDVAQLERRNLVACLIEPKLTLAQAETWQRHSAADGDIKALVDRVRELNGHGEGADKSAVRADGDPG